ncbi:nucleotidyltransferase domain-containing protein [bacterium]|nr:nucleotidyltransferase domain-containing protein [bacterium]
MFGKDSKKTLQLSKRTGIKQSVLDEIFRFAKGNGLEKAVLFGSRSRGEQRRGSDIDLAVMGGNIEKFRTDVEEETSTLLRFDVVDLKGVSNQELLNEISRDGITLYEKV